MNDTKRPRRPTKGGYARGDETRRRIIEAALDLFGEYGYDGASTRDIAARAGVNAPALQYYFESKEGVYRACADYIVETVWSSFEPVVRRASAALERGADTAGLIDAFIGIQEVIADKMFMKSGSANHRLFFAREQTGHEPAIASDILQERLRNPLNAIGAALVARITGLPADDPVTLIRLVSLYGQLMLFHISPRSVLKLLGWSEIDSEKAELMKATVCGQTRVLLELWAAGRDADRTRARAAADSGPAASASRMEAKGEKRGKGRRGVTIREKADSGAA
ncbi:DUF1956 domain-containing protein [Burkholderia sp. WAC0059]|uniref:CerR family C-terminal domain-containing protein n=1 Tax=Burkholderia sp. WAC0059 TaxID=2066022 RepID=UPI000C7E8D4F|nr:CerR family C-terminal domain-containing protein [Burkholderia sp. WAC0059]PLZ04043.1 DUF1956 domain-containing protein [Burkholderia sp. WAC0059]